MSRTTLLLALVGLLFLLYGRSAHTIPLATSTSRVSVRSNGNQANDDSYKPDISADGRFIVFSSDATELVSGDNNDARDIFVHDRQTGITERVSVNSDGEEGNFESESPSISDDGRFVTFYSFATNLHENDTNNVTDIYLHDRETGETTLVNIVLGGQANDMSYDPEISGNGQFITFWSYASNLVGDDINNAADVFRYDRLAQTMFQVSLNSDEVPGNGHSSYPKISKNGRYIAFESDASNLATGDTGFYRDVFWRDMNDGETRRISVNGDGNEVNGDSFEATISADGRYVAFTSRANDVTAGDSNVYSDIFLRDIDAETTERISRVMGDIMIWEDPSVSINGRYTTYRGRPAPPPKSSGCDDVLCEIFIYDRETDTAVRASVSSNDIAGNDDSYTPVMADNGRYLAFSSEAPNLISNDSNNRRDIFLREFLPSPTFIINHNTGKPGSIFAFHGTYYAAHEPVQIEVNGQPLDTTAADANGTLNFRLQSQTNTDEGAYFVTIQADTVTAHASFYLDNIFPTRPDTGSGPTFALPDGLAFTHFQFMPFVAR